MSKANKSSYKRLKAKNRSRTSKKREFNQRFNSTLNKLFPKISPAQKEDKNYDKLISDLEEKYASKLARQQQEQQQAEEQAAKSISDNSNVISNLTQQVQQGNERFEGLSTGVQQALEKIYADKAKQQQAVQETRNPETAAASQQQQPSFPSLEELESYIPTKEAAEKTDEVTDPAEVTGETTVTKKVLKKVLKIDDMIDIGNGFTYKATNLYGPRTGVNFVPGRKDGEHSRGVDLVSHDAEGKKVNLPIAVAEGTIVNIWKQGSGKHIKTAQGKAAGYVVDVRSPNGKIITYAHLGPSIYENKDKFIGKKIQRGDVIVQDSRMSGSGSGPHVKIYMSDSKRNGQSKRNYTDAGNDPTQLILNNTYL